MTELTKYNQWVLWKKDKKRGKVPFDAKSGRPASVNDRETWSSYAQAYRTYMANPNVYNGLGFVFTEEDPFVCIDLDSDTDFAKKVREMFSHTYTEISQSGHGWHIICIGTKPGDRCRTAKVPDFEIYKRGRFVAITRNGNEKPICDCSDLINEIYWEVFGKEATPSQSLQTASPLINRGQELTDDKILEIALKSKSGDSFGALYAGQDVHGDDSANDLALMNHLAFWTGKDPERMERLFSQSALGQRDKWTKREDYRRRTIQKACDDCDEVFEPKSRDINADLNELWNSPSAAFAGVATPSESNETTPPDPPLANKGGEDTSFWAVPNFLKAFNDSGNTDYFARKYEGRLIYSNQDWYIWTGRNWEIITDISEMCQSVAEDFQKVFPTIEDDKFRKQALKWAKESGNNGHISAIEKLARANRRLEYKGRMDSCSYKINCLNGTVNLKTGELTPHDPKEYWHKTVNASYTQDPEVPSYFLNFINSIMDGSKEWTDYMQKVLGYALTGDMKEQSCFWLFGEGSTGKSTLLELMDDIMGDYCTVCDSDMFMSDTNSGFELIDLKDVRMAYSEESCGKKELDGSRFKAVAGGGRQKCKRKYRNSENVTFRAKLFFATNEMPSYMGDYATKRRIRLVPFRRQWTEETRDPELGDKLRKERDGIFTWLVYGAMKYYAEGLAELPEQKVLKEEQIIESDPLAFWIDQSFDRDETSFCSSKELWSWWCLYCDEEHIRNGFSNPSTFMKKLKQITGLKSDTLGKQKTRGVKGLRLKGQ